MSTSTLALEQRRAAVWARLGDYIELTKPKIAVLVLVSVAAAAVVASAGALHIYLLLHTLLGTALIAGSASALNQWLERRTDARMARTADRPLPDGRLSGRQVVTFGAITFAAGFIYLVAAVNLTAALLGLATWVLYVWVYTPLKSRSALNTVVGAVAGATPVLIGWASAAPLDLRSATLFMIVYLWQFPHFMAIAWMYREEYAGAGLKMLSVVDPSGRRAGVQALCSALALWPIGLLPAALFPLGAAYGTAALALGAVQVACAGAFWRKKDDASARRLLRCSLVYLPAVLLMMILGMR